MKRIIFFGSALLIALQASASAAVPVPIIVPIIRSGKALPALVGNFSAIRRFGLIMLVGDEIFLRNQESLFKTHAERTKDISAWKFPAFGAAVVRSYLEAQYQVEEIPSEQTSEISRAEFAHEDRKEPQESSALYQKTLSRFADRPVDAFIVWRPMSSEATPGLWLVRALNGDSFLTVTGHIDVVDAHSFKVLGSSAMQVQLKDGREQFPTIRLEKEIVFSDSAELADQELIQYRELFTKLIGASLPATLGRLGLGSHHQPADDQAIEK